MNTNKGVKFDSEKPRMDLLDFSALDGLARGLTFGANKYGSHNWRGGINNSRLIASLLRHISAIQRGEDIDPESGLPHIDLVGCNWMFLSHNFKHSKHLDDRPTTSSAGQCSGTGSSVSPELTYYTEPAASVMVGKALYNWGINKDSDVL